MPSTKKEGAMLPEYLRKSGLREEKSEPVLICDTATLARADWLKLRKQGIGGSDAAASLGEGLWNTPYDLYRDKTSPVTEEEEPDNWFRLERGNIMEPLIRKWVAKKTGWEVIHDTNMYRHPVHDFMIADTDFICISNEGEVIGGEIKDVSVQNRFDWCEGVIGSGAKMPRQYELQVRHYMAVLDIDHFIVCACCGKEAEDIQVVHVFRDFAAESSLIRGEEAFWNGHVVPEIPPVNEKISARGVKDIQKEVLKMSAPVVAELKKSLKPYIDEFLELTKEESDKKAELKVLEEKINQKMVEILDKAECSEGVFREYSEGTDVYIQTSLRERNGIDTEKLKITYPEVYSEVRKITSYTQTSIKEKKRKGA